MSWMGVPFGPKDRETVKPVSDVGPGRWQRCREHLTAAEQGEYLLLRQRMPSLSSLEATSLLLVAIRLLLSFRTFTVLLYILGSTYK